MQRGLPRARSEAQEARPAQGQIQKPEQGLHRASEQQREVDVHQGPAQGQKVQDKVGPGWLRYQCQDGGTGPRSPTRRIAPRAQRPFPRKPRGVPVNGVNRPPLLKWKQRR